MKMERKFKREDTYTLDAQTTIDFDDKARKREKRWF